MSNYRRSVKGISLAEANCTKEDLKDRTMSVSKERRCGEQPQLHLMVILDKSEHLSASKLQSAASVCSRAAQGAHRNLALSSSLCC